MTDVKGQTIRVGDTVLFSKWDDSKEKPVESRHSGVIVELNGADRSDERAGEVVVKSGKEILTFSTGAVEKVAAEKAAE